MFLLQIGRKRLSGLGPSRWGIVSGTLGLGPWLFTLYTVIFYEIFFFFFFFLVSRVNNVNNRVSA
jgi:hypothetical protein